MNEFFTFLVSTIPNRIIFGLMLLWLIFSIYYLLRVYRLNDSGRYNKALFNMIPSIFTTIGVLGTFLGIFIGLLEFNVEKITESIPGLLEGMKTAFLTSIVGIILALIFNVGSKFVIRRIELKETSQDGDIMTSLGKISKLLSDIKDKSDTNNDLLLSALISDSDQSLSTQILKIGNKINDTNDLQKNQLDSLRIIEKSLGGDSDTSLLTQMMRLREEQKEYGKKNNEKVISIAEQLSSNHKLLTDKFDEFGELLKKSNTEALVEVMKKVTIEFNKQMSELINKLVKENFEELNTSVKNMNTWQKENKEMIQTLTNQFKDVTQNLDSSSNSINHITKNTEKLTNENSHLAKLIEDLQKAMIEDTKFTEMATNIGTTIETLKTNTTAFDETTKKLNDWIKKQRNFTDSVDVLLTRLEEIEKIKDVNEIFWKETQDQMNKGVSIIQRGNEMLNEEIETINAEFYNRLNATLQNLDRLIQRIIENNR